MPLENDQPVEKRLGVKEKGELIALLATGKQDYKVESIEHWRLLAEELHSTLDSMIILAEGYATILRQQKGPSRLADLTDRSIRKASEDFIQPFYAADKLNQQACSTP